MSENKGIPAIGERCYTIEQLLDSVVEGLNQGDRRYEELENRLEIGQFFEQLHPSVSQDKQFL